MQTLNHEIRSFIIESFRFGQDDPTLKDDSSLLSNGVIDSTGVLELVMFLEKTYQLKVADEDLVPENLDSIQRMAQYVQRKQAARISQQAA